MGDNSAQQNGNAVTIEGLRKVYKLGDEKVVALDHIDLAIPKGQVCCLLGPSGSGKSTLLNMIAGLERPSKGTIKIFSSNIENMSERRLVLLRQKRMGFIFQSYNLLGALTAQENVAMPLVFRGVSRRKRNKRALELLKLVGIGKYAKHKPTQMSGGQQQRVGIARAFAADAKIILADEPTGNLDSHTTASVMDLMLRLVHENDQTLIIVTHDLSIANYADRIVHILDGNVFSDEINENPTKPLTDGSQPLPPPDEESADSAENTDTVERKSEEK